MTTITDDFTTIDLYASKFNRFGADYSAYYDLTDLYDILIQNTNNKGRFITRLICMPIITDDFRLRIIEIPNYDF